VNPYRPLCIPPVGAFCYDNPVNLRRELWVDGVVVAYLLRESIQSPAFAEAVPQYKTLLWYATSPENVPVFRFDSWSSGRLTPEWENRDGVRCSPAASAPMNARPLPVPAQGTHCYDNPSSCARELWIDGKLAFSLQSTFIDSAIFESSKAFLGDLVLSSLPAPSAIWLHYGAWQPGRIEGYVPKPAKPASVVENRYFFRDDPHLLCRHLFKDSKLIYSLARSEIGASIALEFVLVDLRERLQVPSAVLWWFFTKDWSMDQECGFDPAYTIGSGRKR
jgi:hypothetical protein